MGFRLIRKGPVRNLGAAPGFNEVRNYFNFRSIRLGAWVSESEKQTAARHFFTALLDLQEILAVPTEVISLRGELSLHYGAGGQPGVSAHYLPASRTLALAKNAGAGSLAHEWFHAFDHYISRHLFEDEVGSRFASTAWLADFSLRSHPLCDQLAHYFRTVLLDASGHAPSPLVVRSMAADKAQNQFYWSRPEELCARCFEACIEDAAIRNNFLANCTRLKIAGQSVYPEGEERAVIARALIGYFRALGTILRAR